MKTTNKILVVGDVHGDWGKLNTLINKRHPDIILQCGDFGYWPKYHNTTALNARRYDNNLMQYVPIGPPWRLDGIKNHDTKIYWCDGNHEDHDSIDALEDNEIFPNIFYMKRGSTLTLPDGRVVLFIGGAESMDKANRTPGETWFPQESITQQDIYNLPDCHVDIVISHTCPTMFADILASKCSRFDKAMEPSCKALDAVYEKYEPAHWYFGHWHHFMPGRYKKTQWTALTHSDGGSIWWRELE
ncbi:MAG: metallophosphoesterase [Candidatus Peribacteraceae bacterium]|nr:metallophosphoesterase [Candidatus Peribacteraceae bacterium]